MTIKLNEHERAVLEEEYSRFLTIVQCIARCHGLKNVTLNAERTEFTSPDREPITVSPLDAMAKSMASASPPVPLGPSDKEIFG